MSNTTDQMHQEGPSTVQDQQTHAAAPGATRIFRQGRYETVAMLKNGEQLMLLMLFPLMALFALAFTAFLDDYARAEGVGRLDIAMPGVLALCAMSTALSGQGIATGFDRRYGVLRFLSTTPLGRGGLIAGKGLAVMTIVAIQYIVIGIVALCLGWQPEAAGVLLSLPSLVLGAAAFTAVGMLVAGTVRAEATLAMVNTLWVVLAAVGGSLFPTHHFPGVVGWLVSLLPSGALGDALRADLAAQYFDWWPHLVLILWIVVAGYAAKRWFKWS
ncbi:ABC transporter permease [Kocuria massiliensis]|uniref:ABC transporter permease n=1 Tax=Kocuria massiliensis TaxID=1926282 RepID=UPI0022B948E8|nr:ABC transporter permease [Kocuria massiliensis]